LTLRSRRFFVSNDDYYEPGIVAITGHRDYPDRAALYRGLDRMSAKQYYFGGARGVDSDALRHLSRTQPQSIRTVVVPNRLIDQPRSAQIAIKRYATNVIELKNSGPNRYMIRNRYIVDKSNRVNAFYDFRGKGGTYNTIEYARKKGKLGTVTSLKDYNSNEFKNMSKPELHRTLKEMKRYKVDVSGLKMLLLEIIKVIYKETIHDFFLELGYSGCKTLEEFWLR